MNEAIAARRALRLPAGNSTKRAKIADIFKVNPYIPPAAEESGGIPLDEDQMRLVSHIIGADESVCSLYTMLLNCILGDGCLAIRRGGENVVLTDRFRRFFDETFGELARQVAGHLVAFGLACVGTERQEDGSVLPLCVEPIHAGIKMGLKNGRTTYHVTGASLDPLSVSNTRVFVLDAPGHGGEVHSCIASTLDLATFMRASAEIALAASKEAADPPVRSSRLFVF